MSKGSETRRRIVSEAATLFNQHGYKGSSMAELMAATGLEKGGIYRHFSNKEELAAEAFDYAWQEALKARTHDLDTISNSVDRLKQFVANFIDRRPSILGGCPLLNTTIDADDGNPVLRQRARKALRGWINDLSSIVAGGIKRKEIRREINPRTLAALIIASLEGGLMIRRLEKTDEGLRAVQAHLDSYLESEVRLRNL